MFKKIKRFFLPLNTAWYSRPTFVFTYLNGDKEEYTPKMFSIYGGETPSNDWRLLFEEEGIICGKFVVSSMRKVETKQWEHICIQWYGSSLNIFDFPTMETKERILSGENRGYHIAQGQ